MPISIFTTQTPESIDTVERTDRNNTNAKRVGRS